MFSLFIIGHLIIIRNSYVTFTLTILTFIKIHSHHFCHIIVESIAKPSVFYFRHWGGPGCGSWAGRCCSSSVSCAGRHSCLPFVTWVWPTKRPKQRLTNESQREGEVEKRWRRKDVFLSSLWQLIIPNFPQYHESLSTKWHSPWASSHRLQAEVPLGKNKKMIKIFTEFSFILCCTDANTVKAILKKQAKSLIYIYLYVL